MNETAKLAKVMETVRRLIALADHPNTNEHEAESARRQADALMFKYAIAEASLSSEERALSGIRALKRTWIVCPYDSEFKHSQYSLAHWAVEHVDGMSAYRIDRDENGVLQVMLDVYGFESDLMYAEAIFTASQVTFSARLEPKIDRNLSDQENVYNLRAAGVERIRIAKLMWDSTTGAATAKATNLYKKECERRGEDATVVGRGVNAKTYRESFAQAFVNGIYMRLLNLRVARSQDSTGEMVLASRKDEVQALYEKDHPPIDWSKYGTTTKSGKQRKLRARKYRATPVNYDASRAGRDAASRVNLTGGNSPKSRVKDTNQAGHREIGE